MSIVYHYCSIESFISIISTGTIRASNIQKSNDILEIQNAIDIFTYACNSAIQSFKKENTNLPYEVSTFFEKWDACSCLQHILNNNTLIYYCACFTEARDLLSQWRGYGDNGNGICIGFDDSYFKQLQKSLLFDYRPVNYSFEVAKKEWASRTLQNLNALASKNSSIIDYENFLWHITSTMVYDTVFYKNSCFFEEKERRLVYYPFGATPNLLNRNRQIGYNNRFDLFYDKMSNIIDIPTEYANFYIETINFAKQGNTIKSYVDINFKNNLPYIIPEIILGPKTEMDDLDLRLFLYKHGIDPRLVKIKKSSVSLQ